MTTLIIDTSLHCAQAALFDNEQCLAQLSRTGDRQAEILLPLLQDILQEARLDWKNISEIVVTLGPGVFTGIRTGLAAARALRLALDIPVKGVGCLHVLAAMAKKKSEPVLALIDAHKGEAYAQYFTASLMPQAQPWLLKMNDIETYAKKAAQIVAYPPAFAKSVKDTQVIEKLDLEKAKLCANLLPLEPLPLYVRAPDAIPQTKTLLRRA